MEIRHADSTRPNHEKLFYRALLKFWEDQLENYPGLEYSASDYHHVPKPKPRHMVKSPSSQIRGHNRKRSQFSIVSDDNYQREGYYKDPAAAGTGVTDESYDPYRASRNPIVKGSNKTTIVVRKESMPNGDRKVSIPVSSRNTAINRMQDDNGSTSPESGRATHARRSSRGSTLSKSSLTNSGRPLSEGRFRKSPSYKRHVSFPHSRKSSSTSGTRAISYPSTPIMDQTSSRTGSRHSSHAHSVIESRSSPALPSPPPPLPQPRRPASDIHVKKPRQGSQLWNDETRKASSDLGKICEEAFNRSSVSSSAGASQALPIDSPATSISTHADFPVLKPKPLRLSSAVKNRPLPEPPAESLGSMTIRELADTRRRLLEHCQNSRSEFIPTYIKEVIGHLDRLMQPIEASATSGEVRSASDPTGQHHGRFSRKNSHSANPANPRSTNTSKELLSRRQESPPNRAISDPFATRSNPWAEPATQRTIRLVSPDISSPERSDKHQVSRKLSKRSLGSIRRASPSSPSKSPVSQNERLQNQRTVTGLDTIEEDPRSPKRRVNIASPGGRKWSWFKRQSDASEERVSSPFERRNDDQGLTAVPQTDDSRSVTTCDSRDKNLHGHDRMADIEAVEAIAEGTKTGRKWFVKMFKRGKARAEAAEKEAEQRRLLESEGNQTNNATSPATVGNPSTELDKASNAYTAALDLTAGKQGQLADPFTPGEIEEDYPMSGGLESATSSITGQHRTIRVSQNWFAKFFHLKPATKLICLALSKSKARREVFKILREWKRYGLKDIVLDTSGSTLFGRVDEVNYFMMKPVDFAGEFFTVLEHGRRGNLCVVRMTQERGAASSFFKVVETLEGALKLRGLIVKDRARKRKMEKELIRSGL